MRVDRRNLQLPIRWPLKALNDNNSVRFLPKWLSSYISIAYLSTKQQRRNRKFGILGATKA